jgi:hypothetical protein
MQTVMGLSDNSGTVGTVLLPSDVLVGHLDA